MNNNEKNRGNLGAVTRLLRLSLAAELNFNCDYVDEFYLLSTGFYLCLPFARPPTPHPCIYDKLIGRPDRQAIQTRKKITRTRLNSR